MKPRPHLAFASAALCLSLGLASAVGAQAPNDSLPDGPGKDVLVRACTSCHDASTITGRARTPQDWEFVIGKMIDGGAELTGAEQDAVYAYLVKNFGAKPPEPAAAPAPAAADKPPTL